MGILSSAAFFMEEYVERLLTIEEASELLQIRPKTLYCWICSKKIPYIKLGSAVRFKESELEAWIESKKVNPLNGDSDDAY
jgi:excisionase family DNA binding protein